MAGNCNKYPNSLQGVVITRRVLFVYSNDFPPKRSTGIKLYYQFLKDISFAPKMFCGKSVCDDLNVISGGIALKSLFVREFVFCINLIKYLLKHRKEIDVMYVLAPVWLSQPAMFCARLLKIKTVFDLRSVPTSNSLAKRVVLKICDILTFICADIITSHNSTLIKEGYGPRYLRKLIEVPIGYDVNLKPNLEKRERPYKFVFLTSMDSPRRIDVACEAFKGLTDYELYIFGDGQHYDQILQDYGNEPNIHIMGMVEYKKLMEILPTFDYGLAFIPQTTYYENQPALKAVECLGAGLPVIATNTQGNRVYVNESNGLLIDFNSVALQNAVLEISTLVFDRKKIQESVLKYRWDNILHKAFSDLAITE